MDSAFQPTDLFAYFESHCQGKVPILRTRNRLPVSPTNGDTSEQCALSGNSTVSMGSEGGEAESSASSQQRSYIARTCSSVAWGCVETGLDAYRWAMDVGAELGKTSNDIVDFFTCRSDDVRDTPRIWMCFWLLLKR